MAAARDHRTANWTSRDINQYQEAVGNIRCDNDALVIGNTTGRISAVFEILHFSESLNFSETVHFLKF